mgnify:CR=1 FL=1
MQMVQSMKVIKEQNSKNKQKEIFIKEINHAHVSTIKIDTHIYQPTTHYIY